MAQRWIIHSRDRTLGPWTSVQVRDELRAGRIDPFDMACKEGSSLKRPLVEVDEIFYSSRVQMGEMVEEPGTKAAFSEPAAAKATQVSQVPISFKQASGGDTVAERPRPSQFQALAAAGRVDPPSYEDTRKPKQYFVTDSTGRSYGPLSSAEVIKLWHQGTLDSRAVVERASSGRRISIQRFVTFYQNAAPSGLAFLQPRAHGQQNVRLVTAFQDSAANPFVWLAILIAAAALVFLGMTVNERLPRKTPKITPKTSVQTRFDLRANQELLINGRAPSAQAVAPSSAAPRSNSFAVEPIRPQAKRQVPERRNRQSAAKPPRPKTITKKSQPTYRAPVRSNPPAPRAVSRPRSAPVSQPASSPQRLQPKTVAPPKRVASAPVALVNGATVTLSGYRFAASQLNQCTSKCKIQMVGPQGPIVAVFFKEALGSSFAGKSGGVTVTGILRQQGSGAWQMIVSSAR